MTGQTTAKSATPKNSAKADRAGKPERHQPKPDKRRTMILFGIDENKKPRAARFLVDENLGLLAKAADTMDLIICEAKTSKLSALAPKLPLGRVHANGTGFVPYIREDLYDALVKAAGTNAAPPTEPPAAVGMPRTFEEIAPGHLVIAQEDLETGWWEAIVFETDADILTLRYRDYPRLPRFKRHRTAVALLSPQPSQQSLS